MVDEKKETDKETEEKTEDKTEPTKTEEAGSKEEQEIVAKAKDAATIAKEAEELKAKNLEKEEKLMERKEALAKLGGGSPAGDRPESKEETPKEYKDRIMAGDTTALKQ